MHNALRVGIAASALSTQVGGIEVYVRNVIRALAKIDPQDDYTLFLDAPLPIDSIPGAEHMRHYVVPAPNSIVRNTITLPLALAREQIDVMHVQMVAPLFCSATTVVTVHDIIYERYPRFFTANVVTQLRILVPLTARRAAAVLTVSEFSKRDIVRRYGVESQKVIVAPCAADPIFRPIVDMARLHEVCTRYGTGERFILCVGNVEPRKNLKTLIAAYVRLRQTDTIRHKLVLVGRKVLLYDDIFAAARNTAFADDLVFTDFVPNGDLVALYNAADLFVFPSIIEGFGMPPLEAMACGTPVVTSNTSSLPEVVGDAGIMVDPLNVEELASAIATILSNGELHAEFSARGLKRATMFSWEATARIILNVYRSVSRK